MKPHQNKTLAHRDRAADLLTHLTPEEKIAQLGGWIMPYALRSGADPELDNAMKAAFANGLGTISYVNMGHPPATGVAWVNLIQRHFVENTRMGIPALFCEECAWGHVAIGATAMPEPPSMGSTWDPDLVERCYGAVGVECQSRGGSLAHTPVADLARDPRWGRSCESFSEDPMLAGAMVAAAVRGLQGGPDGPQPGHIAATVKHFAGFAQSDGGRQMGTVNFGRTALLNEILPPFRDAVEAGVAAVMPAYPEIDGTPCHANRWLLHEVLREKWGFQGLVTADYGGINNLHDPHAIAECPTAAARLALEAGVDMDLPELNNFPHLIPLMDDPEIRARVDAAVLKVLELKFQLGLFENPYPDADRAAATTGAPAHHALAEEAALASVILLKNEKHLLPLDPSKLKRVALLGPHAALKQLGDDRPARVTIAEGLRAALPAEVALAVVPGCRLTTKDDVAPTYLAETANQGLTTLQRMDVDPSTAALFADERAQVLPLEAEAAGIAEAVEAARNADVAILCLGDSKHCAGENYSPARRGDRDDVGLVGNQLELLRAVVATGTPVVVVLCHGRALALGEVVPLADAIVDLWECGEARGSALARVLLGLCEPRGRLAFTLPLTTGSLPVHYNQRPLGLAREYAFRDTKIAFPFGFGLGYTEWAYATPTAPESASIGETVTVEVKVTNTGARPGSTVVQCYLRDEFAAVALPRIRLAGWARVEASPGETVTACITIAPRAFAYHDASGTERTDPGTFTLFTGPNSGDTASTHIDLLELVCQPSP
ncbi:MAG: glycoside hydrolase family 3 C-terminal domain-containing protein [Verrucomicrobia bacterium]|nr:glycoside hydrolase family 3 C-terminal domain-containing protein [Verrucomicrobiota bacterium]